MKPHWITREQIHATRNTHIYIYGDTRLLDAGGGHAQAARGESNTFAIPVKYARCYNDYTTFFTDDLYDTNKQLILTALSRIPKGRIIIVFPKLGEGFNEMPKRAPMTYGFMKGAIDGYCIGNNN